MRRRVPRQTLISNHVRYVAFILDSASTDGVKGDLGLTAESVERELAEKFHLAQSWDCILLLDEADVFLAQRERGDIKRYALVSGQHHVLGALYRVYG